MEFLLADILIPTFDFIWNGIEWVLAILFGTGASGEYNLAQGGRTSIRQNVSLETNKFSSGGNTTRTSVEPEPPTTGPSADETFLQKAADKQTAGTTQIVRDSSPLRFPLNLASEGTGMRPLIRFTCFERDGENLNRKTCYFPCPANIAFGDNANLGTIDLGMLGAGINDRLNQTGGTGVGSGTLTKSFNTEVALAKTLGFGVSKLGVGEKTLQNVKFGLKTVENPYQNTTYSGAGVRTFTFNFKMIAEKPDDALEIKKIHEFFRANMYAGRFGGRESSSSAFLKYPSVWEIDFLTGITDKGITPNKFLPAIYASYLQNFNATFNTTAPTWYKDGAPLEVDITMTYQESRALERNDIETLSAITEVNESGELVNPTLEYNQVAAKGISNKGTARATGINYGDYAISTEENSGGGEATTSTTKTRPPSDIRLKENIYEVDVSPSGIKIYEFKYIDGVDRYRGVMAQDLLEIDSKHPAVSTDDNGFYVVDYDLLDVNMEKIS